jgi:hypothetical protein
VILAAIADQGIPIQTIAPKFTGRFNKGVDYVGDVVQFEKEFNDDLAVIAHAIAAYGLPKTLKLSVHSGSDKFSIYPAIKRAIARTGAGLHIKTLAKKEALCQPYATVIDIDFAKLPSAETVNTWTSDQFTGALRHDQSNPLYDSNVRQLLHVGFKIAAMMGETYIKALHDNRSIVSRCVTENLLDRHMKPLFL